MRTHLQLKPITSVIASVVALACLSGCGQLPDWLQSRFGSGRTGFNDTESTVSAGESRSLRLAWSAAPGTYRTPLVVEDVIYSSGGEVSARSADTGATVWTRPDLRGGISAGTSLYVADGQELHAVSLTDGSTAWAVPFAGAASAPSGSTVYGVEPGGLVTRLRAFAADSGTPLWSKTITAPNAAVPAIDEAVFVTDGRGAVTAFDTGTGRTLWSTRTGLISVGGPAARDGSVFVVGRSATGTAAVVALDQKTGQLRWRDAVAGLWSQMVAVDATTVFVSTTTAVRALDARTGTQRWSATLDRASAPSVAGDAVVVGQRGTVVSLDAERGSVLWRSRPLGLVGAPVIAEGAVFVAGSALWAFRPRLVVLPNAPTPFGVTSIGTTSDPASFSVTNNAALTSDALHVALGGSAPNQFRIIGQGCNGAVLAPGDSCEFAVAYAPTHFGSASATVAVGSAAFGAVYERVSGSASTITVNPLEADLGRWPYGTTSPPRVITFHNASARTRHLVVLESLGRQFRLTANHCDSAASDLSFWPTLAPGASCTVAVVFVSQPGINSGSLNVYDRDAHLIRVATAYVTAIGGPQPPPG